MDRWMHFTNKFIAVSLITEDSYLQTNSLHLRIHKLMVVKECLEAMNISFNIMFGENGHMLERIFVESQWMVRNGTETTGGYVD